MDNKDLPEIPVLDVGPDFPMETLEREFDRAMALLGEAGGRVPSMAVRAADAISRTWLKRWHAPRLAEIDLIAERLGQPGAYYLNLSYEWGCTSSTCPCPDQAAARLARVLDWPDNGLGRHIIAARVANPLGSWITLTWPGYVGVLQAMAPGRFAAALNQGPMDTPVGSYGLDWLINRKRVWATPHLPPAHLLRRVFEEAPDYASAKAMLTETPIALPTIFTLCGMKAGEGCVIERMPDAAHVLEAPAAASNDWQCTGWSGRPRGDDNPERRTQLHGASAHELEPGNTGTFAWVKPPVLNERTRLAMLTEPATGKLWAQGYEVTGPATQNAAHCSRAHDQLKPGHRYTA